MARCSSFYGSTTGSRAVTGGEGEPERVSTTSAPSRFDASKPAPGAAGRAPKRGPNGPSGGCPHAVAPSRPLTSPCPLATEGLWPQRDAHRCRHRWTWPVSAPHRTKLGQYPPRHRESGQVSFMRQPSSSSVCPPDDVGSRNELPPDHRPRRQTAVRHGAFASSILLWEGDLQDSSPTPTGSGSSQATPFVRPSNGSTSRSVYHKSG